MVIFPFAFILENIHRCNINGFYDINILVHSNMNVVQAERYVNNFFNKFGININFHLKNRTKVRNNRVFYGNKNTLVYKYYEILKKHRSKYNKNRIFVINNDKNDKVLFLPLDSCTGIVRVNYTGDITLFNYNMLQAVTKLLLRKDDIITKDYVLNAELCNYVEKCTSKEGMPTGFFMEQ